MQLRAISTRMALATSASEEVWRISTTAASSDPGEALPAIEIR